MIVPTFSSCAICAMGMLLLLYENDDVRAITRRPGFCASLSRMFSVRPSEKYSLSLSALRFAKGSTAMDFESAPREFDGSEFGVRSLEFGVGRVDSRADCPQADCDHADREYGERPEGKAGFARRRRAAVTSVVMGAFGCQCGGRRLRRGEKPLYLHDKFRRRHPAGEPRPRHAEEFRRYGGGGVGCAVDHHGHEKWHAFGHEVRAFGGEFPFQPEIAFAAVLGVGGDDWQEERALPDLAADLLLPRVAPAQFALVKPHLDPETPQRIGDPARGVDILASTAQQDSATQWGPGTFGWWTGQGRRQACGEALR